MFKVNSPIGLEKTPYSLAVSKMIEEIKAFSGIGENLIDKTLEFVSRW